jgi:aerobic-type carbon monoxide dehydrogenase small subunit (CoxS/CutS family)
MGATVIVAGPGGERFDAVASLRLRDDELLVAVRIPALPDGHGWAIHEVAPRFAARALAVACAVVPHAGHVDGARVAVAGLTASIAVLDELDALDGVSPDDETVPAAICDAVSRLTAAPDPRADEDYRREVTVELAIRALRDAARGTQRFERAHDAPVPRDAAAPATPMTERDGPVELTLTVNGRIARVVTEPRTLLSDLLRTELGLSATHVGCEHGVCGACNVLLDGVAVRSCLLLAVQADGAEVQTLEGLRDTAEVRELADAFVCGHALQCGFCTPGFMVTLAELRRRGVPVTAEGLVGNLCRCTGYAPILRAVESRQ